MRTLNKHVTFEKGRTVRGYHRPRVSHNFLTDKTHRNADAVARSDAQTLEKSVECGCPDSTDHSQDNKLCQLSGVVAFFKFKDAFWTRFEEKDDDQTILHNRGELQILNQYHVSHRTLDENGEVAERFQIGFHHGPMGKRRYKEELK